jgi:hypothetical protein
MRNRSSRSFTVETKSGGRQRPIIPHRDTAPVVPRPQVFWPSAVEPKPPSSEPRRILPNLIVPEPVQVEPELTQIVENGSPKPRRGRPPKAKPVAAEVVEEPIPEPAIAIAPPPAPRMPIAPVMRVAKTPATLPPGERWKRRFGRWAQ